MQKAAGTNAFRLFSQRAPAGAAEGKQECDSKENPANN